MFTNDGSGKFTKGNLIKGYQPRAVGDVTQDGWPDIVAYRSTAPGKIFLIRGFGGTPVPYDCASGGSFVVRDLNGDGLLDVVVGASGADVSVFLNQGNGTLGPETTYQLADSGLLDAADISHDGFPDLVVNSGSKVTTLINTNAGAFHDPVTTITAWGALVSMGDLNRDGLMDIVTRSGAGVSVYLNTVDSGIAELLSEPFEYLAGGSGIGGLATVDLNNDGRQDVVVTNPDSNTISVLLASCTTL